MKKLLKRLIGDTSPLLLGWHRSKALVAALRYGFPARHLVVIGITGTDGKTTTVGMTAHILNRCGRKTGALSTAFFQIGEQIEWNATQKTSPSPFVIQRFLRRLVREGCTHAVIECSSHGLLQGRVDWTWPTIGAITNIAEEHLDYHKTMDAYMDAKGLLFRMLRRSSGAKVLNVHDQSYARYCRIMTARTYTYAATCDTSSTRCASGSSSTGHDSCRLEATSIRSTARGLSADVHASMHQESCCMSLPMAGSFNVANALCALSCCHAAGVSVQSGIEALATFRGVPGRMERIDCGQSFSVFVDFTVTPQAYKTTLSTLRTIVPVGKKLLVLMGSCGDRMREKRPVVGKICATLADVVVVTNEDPYTEDPEKIIDEVFEGIEGILPISSIVPGQGFSPGTSKNKFCVRISDRMEAIRWILKTAESGDVVLLCGKGADITMMTAKGQIAWNEREIVRTLLMNDIMIGSRLDEGAFAEVPEKRSIHA